MPHESFAPLVVIAGAFSLAGGIMYLHNYCKFGKPRPTGLDDFGKREISLAAALGAWSCCCQLGAGSGW
eukprot:scaffold90_cov296-Prasinococcus_capsulatus_cf.AAC.1